MLRKVTVFAAIAAFLGALTMSTVADARGGGRGGFGRGGYGYGGRGYGYGGRGYGGYGGYGYGYGCYGPWGWMC